jgi:hypothetical protein
LNFDPLLSRSEKFKLTRYRKQRSISMRPKKRLALRAPTNVRARYARASSLSSNSSAERDAMESETGTVCCAVPYALTRKQDGDFAMKERRCLAGATPC